MLIIDKQLPQQRIIVTVTENSSEAINWSNAVANWTEITSTWDSDATYTLSITSPFSNKTYTIALPENTSPYQDRYDEFIIPTDDINNWDNGFYNYSISEDDESVVEVGILQVIDGTAPTYVSIPTEQSDEKFIVYKNSQ